MCIRLFVFMLVVRFRLPCRSGPPVDRPKDPWPRVLSLPGRFVGDPASLAREEYIVVCHLPRGSSYGGVSEYIGVTWSDLDLEEGQILSASDLQICTGQLPLP